VFSSYLEYLKMDKHIINVMETLNPPLWSSDQVSWLQIQRSEFDSRRYQIFWELLGLEGGPLSLMNTIEELLERKCMRLRSKNTRIRPWGIRCADHAVLTSPTSGGRLAGIVRSRTQATELFFCFCFPNNVCTWGMKFTAHFH
jgi:hypothetical protein